MGRSHRDGGRPFRLALSIATVVVEVPLEVSLGEANHLEHAAAVLGARHGIRQRLRAPDRASERDCAEMLYSRFDREPETIERGDRAMGKPIDIAIAIERRCGRTLGNAPRRC